MARTSAKSSLMKQMRMMISECYADGKVLKAPVFLDLAPIDDEERIRLMLRLTRLVMCTDYCCETTKIYFENPYLSLEGIRRKVIERTGKEVGVSTVQTRIFNDSNRIFSDFGAHVVEDICELLTNDITGYAKKVMELTRKYSSADVCSGLVIDLDSQEYCEDITDEQFNDLLEAVAPYSKKVMNTISSNMDLEVKGYLNKLRYGNLEEEKDKERLRELLMVVFGNNEKMYETFGVASD